MSKLGELNVNVKMNLVTRKALYLPSDFNAMKYGLSTTEPTPVDVFGLFQVKEEDDIDAYFVVELPNGMCCYANVVQIQFIKETEEEAE